MRLRSDDRYGKHEWSRQALIIHYGKHTSKGARTIARSAACPQYRKLYVGFVQMFWDIVSGVIGSA